METTYQPGLGAHVDKATAILLGKTFEQLSRTAAGLSTKTLLDHSRPDDAPTHKLFEWDDEIAGEKYRLHQAGTYIRAVDVEVKTDDLESHRVRAVVPVSGGGRYGMTVELMTQPAERAAIVASAKRELAAWRERYQAYSELAAACAAADEALRKIA